MQKFKHYSFDLWLTLIKSNPEFKLKRTIFFYDNFNRLKKSLSEVGTIFRKVDLMCNSINERTGKNIDSIEMYLIVICIINDYSIPLNEIDLNYVEREMEDLFFQYAPVIYSSETYEVLKYLKQEGNTTSILSNTGFIPGAMLRKVLTDMGIDSYLDFQIYSDEVGISKPNREIFEIMVSKAADNKRNEGLNLTDILHVGDNPTADIAGAKSFGIASLLINSNNVPITSLLA